MGNHGLGDLLRAARPLPLPPLDLHSTWEGRRLPGTVLALVLGPRRPCERNVTVSRNPKVAGASLLRPHWGKTDHRSLLSALHTRKLRSTFALNSAEIW